MDRNFVKFLLYRNGKLVKSFHIRVDMSNHDPKVCPDIGNLRNYPDETFA